MYRIEYLPVAHEDLISITRYISEELSNIDAALNLLDELEGAIGLLAEFPYAHPIHPSPLKLPRETRFFPVKNYLVFYVVIEPQQVVEVQRVIFDRMDRGAVSARDDR